MRIGCERSAPAYIKRTKRKRSELVRMRDTRITMQRNSRQLKARQRDSNLINKKS